MTRSQQVVAAVLAAIVAGGFSLAGVALSNALSSGDGTTVQNSISNSTVNQYYGSAPAGIQPSSSASPSCPEPRSKIGSGTVLVRIEEKASGTACWTQELAPVPSGTTIRYLITYRNLARAVQHNVIIRISLPPHMSLVPNSTYLANSNNRKGVLVTSNDVVNGGIVIGNYGSGANAYVVLSVTVPFDSDLACGWNKFNAVGAAHPSGLNEFQNTAEIQVSRVC